MENKKWKSRNMGDKVRKSNIYLSGISERDMGRDEILREWLKIIVRIEIH